MQDRLVAPWRSYIKEVTRASDREVKTVESMLVAAGRAVLELWYTGGLSREEALANAPKGGRDGEFFRVQQVLEERP